MYNVRIVLWAGIFFFLQNKLIEIYKRIDKFNKIAIGDRRDKLDLSYH